MCAAPKPGEFSRRLRWHPPYDPASGPAGGGRSLGNPRHHPRPPAFARGRGWTEALALRPGDTIVGGDGGDLTVEKATPADKPQLAYNLEVAQDHSYLVGDLGAWAHNGRSRPPCYPENDRQTKGWPGSNQAQNKKVDDAANQVGLNPSQRRDFRREVEDGSRGHGANYTYQELLDIARSLMRN